MESITLKLLYGMTIVILTNILIPAGKYEKQIRFLCGIIFSAMILCVISDICNIYANEIAMLSFPEIAGYEDEYGIYEDINGYILSDYTSQIERDIQNKVYDELDIRCEVSVSVNTDMKDENYGEITSVEISVTDEEDFQKAKKNINSFYGTDVAHIFIQRKEE